MFFLFQGMWKSSGEKFSPGFSIFCSTGPDRWGWDQYRNRRHQNEGSRIDYIFVATRRVWFLWWMVTPEKTNMSSRKGLFQKEGSVFNHYFSKDILGSTLPETNIALQNTTGPKRKRSSSNHWLSGSIYVSFRQCVTVFFGKRSDMDHEWPWWICKDTWIFLVDTKMTCLWVNKSLFVGVSVPWMIKVVLFEQCPRLRWMKMGCWIASPQTMVKCISRCGEICLVSNDFLPWPDPILHGDRS